LWLNIHHTININNRKIIWNDHQCFKQCGADAIVRWRWRCCIFISLWFIVTIICQDKEYLSYFKMKLCPVIPDYLSIINIYGMMDVKSQTLDMKNYYFFMTFFIDAHSDINIQHRHLHLTIASAPHCLKHWFVRYINTTRVRLIERSTLETYSTKQFRCWRCSVM
jgi:hypothetical protein